MHSSAIPALAKDPACRPRLDQFWAERFADPAWEGSRGRSTNFQPETAQHRAQAHLDPASPSLKPGAMSRSVPIWHCNPG
jgi:hypothetical protein